jgi:hypothetical protein
LRVRCAHRAYFWCAHRAYFWLMTVKVRPVASSGARGWRPVLRKISLKIAREIKLTALVDGRDARPSERVGAPHKGDELAERRARKAATTEKKSA